AWRNSRKMRVEDDARSRHSGKIGRDKPGLERRVADFLDQQAQPMTAALAMSDEEEGPPVIVMFRVVGEGAPYVLIGAVHRLLKRRLAFLEHMKRSLSVAGRVDAGYAIEGCRLRHQHDAGCLHRLRIV